MSIQLRNTIKGWFQTGLKPTQAQFRDWIDSFFHLSEDTLPAAQVDGLQALLDAKIDEAPQDGNQYARIDGDWQVVEDKRYKGWYATEAALIAAYPAGADGWSAQVGTTDTYWVWDSDTSAWVNSGQAASGVATEIHAATVKATIADDDEMGWIDSAASWVLKKLTFGGLKTNLKAYFDTIYSAASSWLGLSDTPNAYTGQSGKVVAVKSTEDGLEFTTPSGGSGGHEIQDNGTPMATEPALNFIGFDVGDDSGVATEVTGRFGALIDVDETLKEEGSIPAYDSISGKRIDQPQEEFDLILNLVVTNLDSTADQLPIYVPAGYKIADIHAKEKSGNACTSFNMGTVTTGVDIIDGSVAIGASGDQDLTSEVLLKYFSSTADQNLFVVIVGSAVIDLMIRCIKIW